MFRRGPKRASKAQERRLIEWAKELKKDPTVVIPECGPECSSCPFEGWFRSPKKQIEKIAEHSEDQTKLEKYAKKGGRKMDLAKAVAGTILLAHEGKVKLLKRTSTPEGDIYYAKKGGASNKHLVGVQYFKDPHLRLLAYHKEAESGYYFYSWKDKIICTGKKDSPPEGYVKKAISSLPYSLRSEDDLIHCPHLNGTSTHFILRWISAGQTFKICDRCAADVNSFIKLSEGMLSKKNEASFSLDGRYHMQCGSDCDSCALEDIKPIRKEMKENYFSGSISDDTLIDEIRTHGLELLKQQRRVYAIENTCFGKDKKAFLKALDHDEREKEAVKTAVRLSGPTVLDQRTVNELLEEVWEGHAQEVLLSVIDDKKTVEKMLKNKSKVPRDILREALDEKEKREELSSLPEFKELPAKAAIMHDMVVKYRTSGAEGALQYIKELDPKNTRIKAVAFGFLKAVGKGESYRWKFSSSEVESGEFLSPYFEELLDSEGKEYAEKLQELLKMSGSTRTIILEDGTELR